MPDTIRVEIGNSIGEDVTDSIEAIVCEIISDILYEGLYCVVLSSDYWEVPRYSVHWKKHHLHKASPSIHCTKNLEENIHAAGCFTTLLTHFARSRLIHRKVKSRWKVEGSRKILSSVKTWILREPWRFRWDGPLSSIGTCSM